MQIEIVTPNFNLEGALDMRLGILGGTFDPIHQGHILLAQAAQAQYHLDKVLFIPALIPPHKTDKRDITPAPYRYKMVELALQNHPEFEVSDLEFNRPDISYTVETLTALKEKYPESSFFLIVGADSAADFLNWKEFGKIQQMAVILAARRPGTNVPDSGGVKVQWLEMPECGISSSEIRSRISEGKPLDVGSLPDEVALYVKKMNLYQKGKCEFNS